MLDWLINNLGTIAVLVILAIIVTLIVIKLIKDKKQGRSSCGCGCQNCSMSEHCHKKNN
ncbi:MAG: FeoB-associated Cys-rich membrane protein [Clostridia bacterium]|nr:FeoB-associated Cys-rich membrane protein [Clostridia bacterium]MBO5299416.1 FeoB-associated Cys-rich membrane protein [Clostridia bacterium]